MSALVGPATRSGSPESLAFSVGAPGKWCFAATHCTLNFYMSVILIHRLYIIMEILALAIVCAPFSSEVRSQKEFNFRVVLQMPQNTTLDLAHLRTPEPCGLHTEVFRAL